MELDKIWVDPQFRRQGIAVKLLDAALEASGLKTAYAPNLTDAGDALWSAISSTVIVDGCEVDRYQIPALL